MTSRRGFLIGLTTALAMPAIVRIETLMPVRSLIVPELPKVIGIDMAGGGSGVVIMRYAGPPAMMGGKITQSDGWTIHTFTGGGPHHLDAFVERVS